MPQPSAVTRSASSLFSSTFAERRALGVQHLAAERQDRLPRAIAALLGGAAGGITLDDEELAAARVPFCVQSLSLPGSVRRPLVAALARRLRCCAARLASRARAARMMRATIASAIAAVVIEPVLERRTHGRVDGRRASRGCSGDPSSGPGTAAPAMNTLRIAGDALRGCPPRSSVTPFGDEVVRLDEVADRLADAGAQAVFVRAAGAGGNAVDVARGGARRCDSVHCSARSMPRSVLAREHEGRCRARRALALGDDLLQVVEQPFSCSKVSLRACWLRRGTRPSARGGCSWRPRGVPG